MFKSVSISRLSAGAVLAKPMIDCRGGRLLEPGVAISDELLEQLKQDGIDVVGVDGSDVVRLEENLARTAPLATAPRPGRRIEKCSGCGQSLPLREPIQGEIPVVWVCSRCGVKYSSVLDDLCESEICRHVRPAPFPLDRSRLVQPSAIVEETVRRLVERDGGAHEGAERRSSNRHCITLAVLTLPLDEHFSPAGDPVVMMTRNVSCGGVALVHTEVIDTKRLLVELPNPGGERLQVVVKLLRMRVVGRLFEYGGQFLMKATGTAGDS